jgi:hypothetical protein
MVRRSRAQWLEVLGKFEESGDSIAGFCARHGIRPRTLSWWRWRLGGRRRSVHNKVRLVAVDVAPHVLEPQRAENSIRIALSNLVVHVEVGTDVGYVGALLEALRARC